MAEKKREVVEEMLKGLERTSLASERLRRNYQGTVQEKEGQSESASPEDYAADQVKERMENVPRDSVYAVRKVNDVRRKAVQIWRNQNEQRQKGQKQNQPRKNPQGVERAGAAAPPAVEDRAVFRARENTPVANAVSVQRLLNQKQGIPAVRAKTTGFQRLKEAVSGIFKGISKAASSGTLYIAAGAAVVVFVVILVCMVGMICGSTFGIFFTGQKTDSKSQTMQEVIYAIDRDYDQRIQALISSETHDEAAVQGAKPEWKEVIAVYAVKTNLDAADSQEIASMNQKKAKILEDIFWDMVSLSVSVSETTVIETAESTDESESTAEESTDGGSTEESAEESTGESTEEGTETKMVLLTVVIDGKTAWEMGDIYGFSDEQREYLAELLDSSNDPLWAGIIP